MNYRVLFSDIFATTQDNKQRLSKQDTNGAITKTVEGVHKYYNIVIRQNLYFFLEPVNSELGLAVPNFLRIFSLNCS